jgi:hypothetical protein
MSPILQLWDHHWRAILITLALMVVLVFGLALTQPRKLVEGVYTMRSAVAAGGPLADTYRQQKENPMPIDPTNATELATIAREVSAKVVEGDLRHHTGSWQLGNLDLAEHLCRYCNHRLRVKAE